MKPHPTSPELSDAMYFLHLISLGFAGALLALWLANAFANTIAGPIPAVPHFMNQAIGWAAVSALFFIASRMPT